MPGWRGGREDEDRNVRAAARRVLIAVPSGSSSCVDRLGPPVEAGGRMNEVGSCLQGSTTGELRVLELVDRSEVLVDPGRIRQRPQMLTGLELG